MLKLIEVARRASADEREYRQVFRYETEDASATVASALRELNDLPDLRDVDGNPASPIRWDCSCLQRKCGACAMLVNGVPRAACDARLSVLKGERVVLEPLRKFPVIADLMVDRSALFGRLRELGSWLEGEVELPARRSEMAYEASRCLQCGCCLEVCPNFSADGPFGGMATMVPLARLLAEATPQDRARLASAYREAVFGGCGKSLACRDVCPANIDISGLMARSNAAAVWRRW
ncbi:MAG: 4Fe-4S dicluster domain-containing protein [Atopobiaceae bacterium]|nr:4Fe-4S dicluster domain-containing protein [Atopobiaceae bacterium]